MTDEEIIKGLETEIELAEYVDSYTADNVKVDLLKNALDLINRQKAEIERLKESPIIAALCPMWKAEAIKEFAKFLIDKSENGVISVSDIPDFVKEMTEVKNNGKV